MHLVPVTLPYVHEHVRVGILCEFEGVEAAARRCGILAAILLIQRLLCVLLRHLCTQSLLKHHEAAQPMQNMWTIVSG